VARGLSLLAAAAAVLTACALGAAAPPARAAGPSLVVGVGDDFLKDTSSTVTTARMRLAKLAGFETVRITSIWWPGEKQPDEVELRQIRNVAAAARLTATKVIVSIHHNGSRTTPLTEEWRAEYIEYVLSIARLFPTFTEFVIGNEPNLNRFWMPQFGEDGSSVSAAAYMELLAATYDAIKARSTKYRVWGGALAPRGIDRPGSGRDTHSPTRFIRDLGEAYRLSGRERPIMDGLAIHPYGDSSSQPPILSAHPRTTAIGLADYGKLVRLLGEAFDGTPQRGTTLPILYDEFGVESRIPAAKARLYTGAEPTTTRPVDEPTQGEYYRQALGLAFCQPNVRGLILFHLADEPALAGWQSGVYYVDGKAKRSLPEVTAATRETKRGVVAHCPGLKLVPGVRKVLWPRGTALGGGKTRLAFRVQCTLDCAYRARLVPAAGGRPALELRGRVIAGILSRVRLPLRPVKPGSYVLRVTLTAPVNPGRARTIASPALRLRRGIAWPRTQPKQPLASGAARPSTSTP
jgi:hypothetical protein